MLEVVLLVLVGAITALAVLSLVRKSRAIAQVRRSGYRARPPGKAGTDPESEPAWVKVAGPQAWRERKDVGCQQCAPSWELGMKTCVGCGRRLADVFTAGGSSDILQARARTGEREDLGRERAGRTWRGAPTMAVITEHENQQIKEANASGLTPVVFVHGLWLLPSSWDRWREVFRRAGYAALAPGWPDDPETVAEAKEHPEVFAGKSIKEVADHFDDVIQQLTVKPVVIGHSFGGLLTQILAGRGLSAASVAIDPAPFRGVLPLPISALRAASPVLSNPLNHYRAVPLTYEQFRFAFANAVPEVEAKELFATYAVPASGEPLFQAASANLNPWTQAKVDTMNPERGPLLIIDGEKDNTVPWAIANASYERQKRNEGVTEIVKIPGRGHSLTIDSGWREVADTALAFIQRFVQPSPKGAPERETSTVR